MLARPFEPFADKVDIRLGSANARGRFFLERVEDIDKSLKAHCIDGPIGVALKALDEFEDAGPFALPRFGGGVFASKLGDTERIAHLAHDIRRKVEKVGLGGAHPLNGFLPCVGELRTIGLKYTQLGIKLQGQMERSSAVAFRCQIP